MPFFAEPTPLHLVGRYYKYALGLLGGLGVALGHWPYLLSYGPVMTFTMATAEMLRPG